MHTFARCRATLAPVRVSPVLWPTRTSPDLPRHTLWALVYCIASCGPMLPRAPYVCDHTHLFEFCQTRSTAGAAGSSSQRTRRLLSSFGNLPDLRPKQLLLLQPFVLIFARPSNGRHATDRAAPSASQLHKTAQALAASSRPGPARAPALCVEKKWRAFGRLLRTQRGVCAHKK